MIWYLADIGRLDLERKAIANLERRAGGWLANAFWDLDANILKLDADILVGAATYPVSLRYPYAYPACPPSVLPRNATERWSREHQYGRSGELCLEWGPDNWHPELTGADMLESAFRLLSAESPLSDDPPVEPEIPTRHRTTPGQDLRRVRYRLVTTVPMLETLATLPVGVPATIRVRVIWHAHAVAAMVTSASMPGGKEWTDQSVPISALDDMMLDSFGIALRWPDHAPEPSEDQGASSLITALMDIGVDLDAMAKAEARQLAFVLLVASDNGAPRLLWLLRGDNDCLVVFETLRPPDGTRPRLEPGYKDLAGRRVGIVGCGSLGSKVATSLARSGVGEFVLIDDDVLRIDNLVRNDLDWRSTADHKVDGLARRLALVNPAVRCDMRKARLAGQEASGFTASVIKSLTECDLVIDATADPSVFNVLAGAVKAERKPMVWAEIFAGGIGGLVARHRPGRDPDPQTMRRAVLAWCAEQDAPPSQSGGAYATERGDPDASPLVADDGDVSVIAGHTVRMAADVLLAREPSRFPRSVYLVGLARGWIFGEPFETQPIDVGTVDGEDIKPDSPMPDQETIAENVDFLIKLIGDDKDEAPSST